MTWSWPWFLLSMSLVPVHYLHHTFESTLAPFGPREAECGIPRPPNLEPPHFGIWPDIDLTRDLLRKFSCFRIVFVRPFQHRLTHLSTTFGSPDNTGGGGEIHLPRQKRRYGKGSGGAGLTRDPLALSIFHHLLGGGRTPPIYLGSY